MRFFDHVSCRRLSENESYKHLRRKVDQWLVFAIIRQKMSSFCLSIVNKNCWPESIESENKISYLTKNTARTWNTERRCFLTFLFEENFRKYNMKRKHAKTNEKMILSVLFTNFRNTKILFSCSAEKL